MNDIVYVYMQSIQMLTVPSPPIPPSPPSLSPLSSEMPWFWRYQRKKLRNISSTNFKMLVAMPGAPVSTGTSTDWPKTTEHDQAGEG